MHDILEDIYTFKQTTKIMASGGNVKTTVINIRQAQLRKIGYKSLLDWLQNPNHVYIGRHNAYVRGATHSKWANPFSVKKYGRDRCIEMYEESILNNKELFDSLAELKGKTLGCWCSPDPCHGHVLQRLVDEHCQ